VKRRMEHLTCH